MESQSLCDQINRKRPYELYLYNYGHAPKQIISEIKLFGLVILVLIQIFNLSASSNRIIFISTGISCNFDVRKKEYRMLEAQMMKEARKSVLNFRKNKIIYYQLMKRINKCYIYIYIYMYYTMK